VLSVAVLSVAALSVVFAGPAPPARAFSSLDVGVVSDLTWGISAADMDRTVSAMSDAGVKWARMNVNWDGVERDGKGLWNTGWLAQLDAAVSKARAAGIQVLMPFADGVPYWASADPAKYADGSGQHWNHYWRPVSWTDYADFSRTMVNRYKGQGVHAFQVWNEPDHTLFWPSGPNAGEYAQMLAAAQPAIRQADPGATVVLGGLSNNDYPYLRQLYAAGGRPYFDAVADHPYTGSDPTLCWSEAGTTTPAQGAFCGIESVRSVMVDAGDSAKTIWITEFGWSTAAPPLGVSEATQADYLTKAVTKLESYSYVAKAFWYNFRNSYWEANDPSNWEANLGLLRTDFSPKPAFTAFKSYAATAVVVGPPAVDTTAPVISGVTAQALAPSGEAVKWTTNEPSTSLVEYWVAGSSTVLSTGMDATLVTSHRAVLSSLSQRTKYSYRVRSTDGQGNASVSGTSSFTTKR
jgi:hypothetical protein